MQTISTISSISFNTPAFFRLKIKELQSGGLIDWAHWIVHRPETDETKEHIHFVLKPSRRVITQDLQKQFLEPPPAGSDDVRWIGVLPFEKTNSLNDWLLYAVHDFKYLLKKGQSRVYHYERSDVESTDPDLLREKWHDVVDPLEATTSRVLEMIELGKSFSDILATGIVPPNQVIFWREMFLGATHRAGRSSHGDGGLKGGWGNAE